MRVCVVPAQDGRHVLVGQSLTERAEALHSLKTLLWICGLLLLLLVATLSWFITKAALRPVERMRQIASALSADNLDQRLQVPDTGDEIARLGGTLNEMLARLEQSIGKERRIIDDASHELRTPLAVLKTELDLALRRSRTNDELRSALQNAADVSDQLNRLAMDILVLARSNDGNLPLFKQQIDVSQMIAGVIARFANRCEERRITVESNIEPHLLFEVDDIRLQQALSNVLDNAIAQSPEGCSIEVRAHTNTVDELAIVVTDNGGGFPPDFIEIAFDPFTRAETGRSRRHGGTRLGLAIVSSIVKAHGGTVTATNRPRGGASVSLRIPSWTAQKSPRTSRIYSSLS